MPPVSIERLALLEPLSLAMLLPYLGLIAWQRLVATRPLPLVRGWELRAAAVLAGDFHLSPRPAAALEPRAGCMAAGFHHRHHACTLIDRSPP